MTRTTDSDDNLNGCPSPGRDSDVDGPALIWILGTPISSVGPSISNETFDIEDFDIECSFDIDVFYIRYRISISKVFDIELEGHLIRYRRGHTIDIKCY